MKRTFPGMPSWRKALLVLIAANALLLAYAVREFTVERALYRTLRERTPEAYAEAVPRAGRIRDHLLVNLGNLYFEQGARRRWPAAVRTALAYYREALRLNPELLDAKKNYEVARRLLNDLVPPREPREPRPPDRFAPSQMPLQPTDI
ncbi:MAG: tetratricopeptide repeat protein [Gemmatimonadota bacterium]